MGVVDVFGAEMWAVWRAEWETDPGACPFLGPFGIRLVDLVDTFAEKYTGMVWQLTIGKLCLKYSPSSVLRI